MALTGEFVFLLYVIVVLLLLDVLNIFFYKHVVVSEPLCTCHIVLSVRIASGYFKYIVIVSLNFICNIIPYCIVVLHWR